MFDQDIKKLRRFNEKNNIGIELIETDIVYEGFIEGILIVDGKLVFNRIASIGHILHEYAHLATLPDNYRILATGDIGNIQKQIKLDHYKSEFKILEKIYHIHDDSAIAYAYALGKHLRIAEKRVIEDDAYIIPYAGGYGNYNYGNEILRMLKDRSFPGISSLFILGLTDGINYPKLTSWKLSTL